VIFTLTWENIRCRPVRTLLNIFLLALPVTLILTLIGLSQGFIGDSAKRVQGAGADIVYRPPGSSVMALSGMPLPEKLIETLSHEPHVAQATGVGVQNIGGFDNVTGIDLDGFNRMSGGFTLIEGHLFRQPGEVLVDRYYAAQRHVHAGGTLNLLNRGWTVAGVVEPGKLAHLFVPLHELQGLVSATGKISLVYLKLDDPARTDQVIEALKAKYDNNQIFSMKEMMSLISVDNVPMLSGFIDAVIGLGVVVGFAVAFLAMYMAVLQRTREIGIFKSLGATKGFITSLILAEAFALGLGGTVLGILFTFGTRWVMSIIQPASLPEAIVFSWWPIAGLVIVAAALLGALYPATMALRQDPIEALAYE
jgi:putative ABC transport system permease protein